jgi:glutamyl-Q tRNA(Asp) synthetase
MASSPEITRFAPSPTGPLHLGHAYAAMVAHDLARASGGRFLIRIEDIDRSRCRPEWEARIFEDLAWLGLSWDPPVWRQSERLASYEAALDRLWDQGLLYPCTCNRRDILAALDAPQEGVPMGPDGPVYPGTCRHKPRPKIRPTDRALRLDMAKALPASPLHFHEEGLSSLQGKHPITTKDLIENTGDIALSRRDMGTSYHLSVVIDDAAQGITLVTRGADLFAATKIHVLLQHLLGLPTPRYHHHRLIRDEMGKRLAKRDDARALEIYRTEGLAPDAIRQHLTTGETLG